MSVEAYTLLAGVCIHVRIIVDSRVHISGASSSASHIFKTVKKFLEQFACGSLAFALKIWGMLCHHCSIPDFVGKPRFPGLSGRKRRDVYIVYQQVCCFELSSSITLFLPITPFWELLITF